VHTKYHPKAFIKKACTQKVHLVQLKEIEDIAFQRISNENRREKKNSFTKLKVLLHKCDILCNQTKKILTNGLLDGV